MTPNEEKLFKIQSRRDALMMQAREFKNEDYRKGYFEGVLDAYNDFKRELKG